MVYKTMKCLTCKEKLGNPKFCSPKCQKEAGKRFDRILGNLKREKRPWGEIIRGEPEKEDVV